MTDNTIFHLIFIVTSIASAWIFSVVTNNFIDYKIDKITNKKRPSITGKIPTENYKKISLIFLLVAIIYSSAVNFTFLFLTILFIGNYFLYSMPPLRLKRVTFLSKIFISLNSLALFMAGYSFVTGTIEFSNTIVVFFLIFFTAAVNFIDIKDYEGDKKAGIKTIPVVFGLKKGKIIIGLFFLISYLIQYRIYNDFNLFIPSAILGSIQFFLINRRNYKENHVFLVYIISIVILILYLLMFKV